MKLGTVSVACLGITIGIHALFPFGHEYAERQEGNVYARNVFSNLPSLYRGSLRRRVIGLQGPHELAQSSKRQSAEFLPDPYLQALCESSVHFMFQFLYPCDSPLFPIFLLVASASSRLLAIAGSCREVLLP